MTRRRKRTAEPHDISARGNAGKPSIAIGIEHHIKLAVVARQVPIITRHRMPTRCQDMQLLIVAPAHRLGLRKLGAERTGDDRIDKIQMSRKPSMDVGDLVTRRTEEQTYESQQIMSTQ